MNKFSLISLLCFVGFGACAVACSSDDDSSPSSNAGTGGTSGHAGTAGKGGTAGTAGKGGAGGTAGTAEEAGSGGEGGAIESTLYYRLGEYKGISDALDAIIGEELKDPIIASYFSQVVGAHKPSGADIHDCFAALLGSAAGGPEVYPVKLADGYQCRPMAATHATLGIGSGTFDLFVEIAATTLTSAGVSDADVKTIGSVLNGTSPDIVDPNIASGAAKCKSPASCALPVEGEAGATGEGGAGGASSEGGAAGAL